MHKRIDCIPFLTRAHGNDQEVSLFGERASEEEDITLRKLGYAQQREQYFVTARARSDLSEIDRARLKTLLQKMDTAKSEEWSKMRLKIVFLSPADSPDTLVLPHDILNNLTSESRRGTAFTQGQRYVSLSRLQKGPKTTSELI